MQAIIVNLGEGQTVTGYQFSPSGKLQGKVIIAPAMGVPQRYYHPIARWLTSQGFEVTTFDYRGMGESRQGRLSQCRADIIDWATKDCKGVLDLVLSRKNSGPVYWLGHSLGGQIFPLIEGIERVDKVITVASGTGYWRHNAADLRRKVWFLWYLLVPLLTPIYGYFPGSKLGMVGDLPKPVIRQWRQWCLNPRYCVGVEQGWVAEQFAAVNVPLKSFGLADDEMLSEANMRGLFTLFGMQDKSLHMLQPTDFGVKRIGHLGYFREEFADPLWAKTLLPELTLAHTART